MNIIKAFENGHPFFEKYKRWIYRRKPYFADFLKNHGVNLTLDSNEQIELINLINAFIDTRVQEIIEHPSALFNNNKISYIDLLNSSISYCSNFSLFKTEEETLTMYIKRNVHERIKSMFFANVSDENLRSIYYEIRRNELDPVGIYPIENVYEYITEEMHSMSNNPKLN